MTDTIRDIEEMPRIIERQAAEIERLREIIDFIRPALPVLRTMCAKAGLKLGVAKADETIAALAAAEAVGDQAAKMLMDANAALATARNDALEEAAKVAERYYHNDIGGPWISLQVRIAADIRALNREDRT